ncbi:MAG: 1-acyl-sn-glycerol-3-phosphate acyltransferase [Ruminococcaceae bacterium]|nr:1-acyl-sn-glycerol-3-phosphate acyltransferase [Oscillospiraceae bacterium]
MFYKIVRKIAWIITKLLFFIRIKDANKIPAEGGCVICPNHRSLWDAVLVAAAVKRPLAYIAKEELFKNKLFAAVLRSLHCFPVRRGGGDLAVVKTALQLLKNGEALVIFPEGERIRGGKKPNPKPGAFRLATMTGVPVIPVGIGGNFRLFQQMQFCVGDPIDTKVYKGQRMTEEEYDKIIKDIMQKCYTLAGMDGML